MASVVRKNDRGYKNMLKNLAYAKGGAIGVGIFAESQARRSRVAGSAANNLAYRYAIHDEGRGNNPRRETLLPAFNEAVKSDRVVNSFLSTDLDKNPSTFKRGINRAGLRLTSAVKKEITKIKTPKKKRSTIEGIRRRYGGTRANPLIATGEMRNAVNFKYSR